MSWARIVKNMSYSLRGWNAIIKIFLINCLSLLTNNTFPTKPQVAVGTIMLIILSKIFWSGWLWSPVASVTPTAVTPGAGPPCLPPHKASSSSWWQSILPGDSLGQPPCGFPPPPRVGLHDLPKLSLADLDTALGGPDDDHLLAVTLGGLLLPLPCPLTVGGPPGKRLGCTRDQEWGNMFVCHHCVDGTGHHIHKFFHRKTAKKLKRSLIASPDRY